MKIQLKSNNSNSNCIQQINLPWASWDWLVCLIWSIDWPDMIYYASHQNLFTVKFYQYHTDLYMGEWSRTNIVTVITFVMMNKEMHVTAPTSLMWTGFLLLEIHVKRNYLKGSLKLWLVLIYHSLNDSKNCFSTIGFVLSSNFGEGVKFSVREWEECFYHSTITFQFLWEVHLWIKTKNNEWGLKFCQLFVYAILRSHAIMASNILTLEEKIKREGKHFNQSLANVKVSSWRYI